MNYTFPNNLYDKKIGDYEVKECFFNPENEDCRVTFMIDKSRFMVVKFNNNYSYSTVKFWRGDYDQKVSYWNTKKIANRMDMIDRSISEFSKFREEIKNSVN